MTPILSFLHNHHGGRGSHSDFVSMSTKPTGRSRFVSPFRSRSIGIHFRHRAFGFFHHQVRTIYYLTSRQVPASAFAQILQRLAYSHLGPRSTQFPRLDSDSLQHLRLIVSSQAHPPDSFVKGKEWSRRQRIAQ
jgi:hypothetical protein